MGYRLDIGFIDRPYKPLGTTSNYGASLHTLQFTTAPAKPFPACRVIGRSLSTAANNGDSSALLAHVLPSPTIIQNFTYSLN
jgi:hypothetical protein